MTSHYDEVLAVLAGRRIPLEPIASKTLMFILQDLRDCDGWIDRDAVHMRVGGRGFPVDDHISAVGPSMVSQLLEWSHVSKPVTSVHAAFDGRAVLCTGYPTWLFERRRFLWLDLAGDRVTISMRLASGLEVPPAPEVSYEHVFVALGVPCPHCRASSARYRRLSGGSYVCPACGRSFDHRIE